MTSFNNLSLLSIITPCLNRAEFIMDAIQSVQNQNYINIEHIIIDGGSTDGTLEILEQYSHLHLVSEPDQGMYEAINKGIALAKGEIIGFLNTDDFYEPNIFGSIVQQFQSLSDIEAVVGGADIFEKDSQGDQSVLAVYQSPTIDDLLNRLTEGTPIFNAWFFRSKSLKQIGDFNTHYLYTSDREYLIRFYMQSMNFKSMDSIVYHYRQHPSSITMSDKFDGETNWMLETLELAETYIKSTELNDEEMINFRSWHSHLINDMIITALKRKSIKKFWEYSRRGNEYNPYWFIKFIARVGSRISR